MKRYAVMPAVALLLALAACTSDSTAKSTIAAEQNAQAKDLASMLKSQPVPHYDWSQIRQTLIDTESAQANTTQTTSFFFLNGVADPIYTCPSIGLPVPLTSQITNPSQLITNNDYSNQGTYLQSGVVSQIDPNGIYSGNSSATAVICIGAGGKPYIHHAEEIVHAVTGAATWDQAKHRIVVTGDPTFKVKVGK